MCSLCANNVKDKSMTSKNNKGTVKRKRIQHIEDSNIDSVVNKLRLVSLQENRI